MKRVVQHSIVLLTILLVFVTTTARSVPGQKRIEPHIRFTHLTIEDGLSDNVVTAILQDRRGFLWIGTENGLNRFDGYTFTTYTYHSTPPQSRRGEGVGIEGEAAHSSVTMLQFAIADTGCGIAPDEIEKVFEAFEQTAGGRRAGEGTGLGVPISRTFAHLMGGDLSVNSTPGEGTTFELTIRATPGAQTASQQPQALPKPVVGIEPDQPRSRILVVDDAPNNRYLLLTLLTPLGFEIREAENGKQAVALWHA